MIPTMQNDPIYITEVAELINRRPHTIRDWERKGVLPDSLKSNRSSRGWRYWTNQQIQGIKEWMKEEDMRPGKGLPHYKPTDKQIELHILRQRRPRKNHTANVE